MEAINVFLQKEIENNFFDREINGIKYWEYIRPIVSCEVNTVVSKSSKMFSKNSKSIKKYILSLKNIKKYFLTKPSSDILIISQPRRIYTIDGFKNCYIDYYVDYLKNNYKVKVLEEPSYSSLGISNVAHNFPLYTENIYLTDIHEIIFLIKKFLYKLIKYKSMKKIINEYDFIRKEIISWYDINDINFKNYFIDSVIRLQIDRKYIKKLLNKIKPKIVMLHYMPSTFKEMLIAESNIRGIPTIEIQHGTITKVDPLVNKCLDVNQLKVDNKYIFSFGENQVHKYALSIRDKSNIKVIGFPFFEEKLKSLKLEKKSKSILIISQSTIGEQISMFASQLADLLVESNYKIIFKYHPNELTKNYSCLNKKNIIQVKTERNIYDIQREVVLQIGSYSTSLYEGFAMKVPTLVVKSIFGSVETIDIFNQISKGVYFIDKPIDVLNYIDKDDIIPQDEDIKKLWASNSKNNLLKTIKSIIEKEEK